MRMWFPELDAQVADNEIRKKKEFEEPYEPRKYPPRARPRRNRNLLLPYPLDRRRKGPWIASFLWAAVTGCGGMPC
jgi:hypothetical protein